MIGINSLSEVFQKVTNKDCDAGVIPLENTTTGNIADSFDLLLENKLSIIGEVILKIHHQLLVNKGQKDIKKIKYCYSHPQAISQCESFLAKYSWIKPKFTSDTASAAKIVSQRGKAHETAIAGNEAAEIYNLKLFKHNIEDNQNNFTRFAVISDTENKAGGKISVAFSVEHVAGSLFRALKSYAQNNLNLLSIESRPVFGKPWEYIFFVDFEVDNQEKELQGTLSDMKENCRFLTILGRYQKGKIYET